MNEYRGRYRQKRKETDAEYQQRIAAQLKNVVGKALSLRKSVWSPLNYHFGKMIQLV